MCGIVGYVGNVEASPFLLTGLQRLEYRGYDSAGIATLSSGQPIHISRAVGRIERLSEATRRNPHRGLSGIGHTRWATHGPATEENAHPHLGGIGQVVIAHNGVIENYETLKERLIDAGYHFASATDSEVIAHLIADHLKKMPVVAGQDSNQRYVEAVRSTLSHLRGTYGLAVMFRDRPDLLIAARCGSPLVLGIGRGEHFLASDTSPLVGYTDRIIFLADHQIAVLTPDALQVLHRDQGRVRPDVQILEGENADVAMHGYKHFMQKEIFEQPESLTNAMRGRLDRENATAKFGGLNLTTQQLRSTNRIILTGCGTSWHSALVGEYLIEELARIPVEVEYASELRY
ncbi:MAG: Glutamine--fructose-6-phosphate aminotransferase, partial [Planctomycetota bacterium]